MNTKIVKKNLVAYSFILPAFIAFLCFMAFPMIGSLILSTTDWNLFSSLKEVQFVGLDNFIKALHDEYFITTIKNTLVLALLATPVLIVSSLLLSNILNQKIYARNALRTMLFMPYITAVTASAVVFSLLFHPVYGPINSFLRYIGISSPPQWIGSIKWALPTVALFWIWKRLGYCIVIYLAALQGIPKTYYEAAEIDGASGIQKFLHITVPLVSPTTFFLLITTLINAFKIFPAVKVMTEGGPGTSTMTIVYYIYRNGFQEYKMGYASAVACLFFVLVLTITIIQWLGQKKWVKYD